MAFIPLTEDQWVFCQKLYKKDLNDSDPDVVYDVVGDEFGAVVDSVSGDILQTFF